MILCSWLYGVCVCSIFVFPELYLCVALIYDGRENMSSLVWVAMINQGVKFILFDIIALWLVSWWSAKGKDDKMELYVVCSLICIMMIRQGVFSFLLLNIFALWLVSWWSAKAKCQDGAIWRMLLGLYHNDQPRRKMNMMRDIGRSKKIRGGSWFPPCLPSSGSSWTAALQQQQRICGWEQQRQHNSSSGEKSAAACVRRIKNWTLKRSQYDGIYRREEHMGQLGHAPTCWRSWDHASGLRFLSFCLFL